MKDDQYFLRKAIEVGNKMPEPTNFGAVVVKDGEIIASDHNHVHEQNDPTLHAETSAIKAACKRLGAYNIDGCTLYGSHEPCLMCFSCAAWANIERVVYATAANEQDFSYEFEGVSLKDLAAKLKKPIKVEQIDLIS